MAGKDPLIGQKFGDYKILNLLGHGGMARVYRGHDEVLDRYAAIKVIEPNLLASGDEGEYRERFLREARAIARLDHPRIVRIYQFGQSEDHSLYYMAMSFIDGRDLNDILRQLNRQGKRLSNTHILQILSDIASALDYAHRRNVIHRDVKSSNIMVTPEGRAVLTDFGLAFNADEGTLGTSFGSVHYIAPEQAISSSQAQPQSDIYSLGVVLFEMLTGSLPFQDTSPLSVALKHISDPPPLPSSIDSSIRWQIDAVVMKALRKSPEMRYQTAKEMIEAFETAFLAAGQESADSHAGQSQLAREIAAARAASGDDQGMENTIAFGSDFESFIDDTRTISLTEPAADDAMPSSESGRRGALIAGILLVVLVITAGLVLLSGVFSSSEADSVAADSTVTVIASVTEPPTTTLAPTRTPAPTEPATHTPVPTAPNTPSAIDTNDSNESALQVVQADEAEAEVLLRYDGRTLVLFNRSDARINIADLTFTRLNADNVDTITYRAREWGVEPIFSLRDGDCLQVWTVTFLEVSADEPPADICRFRQGTRQTSRPFWVTTQNAKFFEVRLFDEVLARCPVVSRIYELDAKDLVEQECLVSLDTD